MDSFCAPAQSARKVTIRRFLGLIGVIPNARLCENSIGTLRLSSGRADKYLDSNEAISFVVSAVEP
jgi:hypothetical protein